MQKINIVRLSEEERDICLNVLKKLAGYSEKVRCVHILLKADADGPNWKDQNIADASFRSARRTGRLDTCDYNHQTIRRMLEKQGVVLNHDFHKIKRLPR